MQNILIFLSIYITGFVISYLLHKKDFIEDFGRGNWTHADRAFVLLISTTSWGGVISAIIIYITKQFISNKRAKW